MLGVIVADPGEHRPLLACIHAGQSLASQLIKPMVHDEHERNGLSEECSANGKVVSFGLDRGRTRADGWD